MRQRPGSVVTEAPMVNLDRNERYRLLWKVRMAEEARNYALDPTLSGFELTDARKSMEDAAFQRDRLQVAVTKSRERFAELKDYEENARRLVAYDKAKADELGN
jgi:hypothetical protein